VVTEDSVSIELTGDEALVLYAWLVRFDGTGDASFADQAEQRVLWDVHAMLESSLVAPFDAAYLELVAKARARVRDSTE
jgi:hypothetical protein